MLLFGASYLVFQMKILRMDVLYDLESQELQGSFSPSQRFPTHAPSRYFANKLQFFPLLKPFDDFFRRDLTEIGDKIQLRKQSF